MISKGRGKYLAIRVEAAYTTRTIFHRAVIICIVWDKKLKSCKAAIKMYIVLVFVLPWVTNRLRTPIVEKVVGAEIIDHRLLNFSRSSLAERGSKQAEKCHTQKKKLTRFIGKLHFCGNEM